MSDALKKLEEIERELDRMGFELDRWLEQQGWKQTPQTPGSVWMWQKSIDGVMTAWIAAAR